MKVNSISLRYCAFKKKKFSFRACGILVPQPGIEPTPPAVEAQSLNHWTAREVPTPILLNYMLALILLMFLILGITYCCLTGKIRIWLPTLLYPTTHVQLDYIIIF